MVEKNSYVFVISQIGEQDSSIRERANVVADRIVNPVAKKFDLQTWRSDRDPTPGPITPQILRSILDSRLVVADLTGRNPNVYYELCFAQSFGIPAVMLVDKPSSLPFDVKDERVITIGGEEGTIDFTLGDDARNALREMFSIILQEDFEPHSIINEVASVRTIDSVSPTDPMASEISALTRRIEQIHGIVSSPSSSRRSPYKPTDLRRLMKIVTSATKRGIITPTELEELITDRTSEEFDDWVRETKEEYPSSELNEDDFKDIPF